MSLATCQAISRETLGSAYQRAKDWGTRFLALCGLLALLVVATPAAQWLMPRPAGSFEPPPGDTLVVLGAGVEAGLPDLDTYWRCIYAARFFQRGSFRRLVLAGGRVGGSQEPLAAVMANYLRSAGISPDQIFLETSSRSTRENALFVQQLLRGLPAGRVVLLTSDYHTRRAAAAFRRVGLPVTVVAVPYVLKLGNRPTLRPMLLTVVLYEHAKRLWYRWKGWT